MLMVGIDPTVVERLLLTGELTCPSCEGVLRPWGHARLRSSRADSDTVWHRPRRASCSGCTRTHVLLASRRLLRRADAVLVIGAALLAKAAGAGHRSIAARLGRPASTVRGWLRRFTVRSEEVRALFTGLLHAVDPEPGPLAVTGSVSADALEALGRAASAAVVRVSPGSPWEFASRASGGLLLALMLEVVAEVETPHQTDCRIVLSGCHAAVDCLTKRPVDADRNMALLLPVPRPIRSVVVLLGLRRAALAVTKRPVRALLLAVRAIATHSLLLARWRAWSTPPTCT